MTQTSCFDSSVAAPYARNSCTYRLCTATSADLPSWVTLALQGSASTRRRWCLPHTFWCRRSTLQRLCGSEAAARMPPTER
jgi:hypothetical protein